MELGINQLLMRALKYSYLVPTSLRRLKEKLTSCFSQLIRENFQVASEYMNTNELGLKHFMMLYKLLALEILLYPRFCIKVLITFITKCISCGSFGKSRATGSCHCRSTYCMAQSCMRVCVLHCTKDHRCETISICVFMQQSNVKKEMEVII